MYVTSPVNNYATEVSFIATIEDQVFEAPGQIQTFAAGSNLFFECDDADYIYEIISGVVRSSKVLMDGRRQVMNFGYPGDMMGLSHDQTYHCDCDAVSDVKVRIIRKNAFKADMGADPEFCARLLKRAVAEVNNMQEHFIMLGRKTAMEKLASFLVAIMDRQSETKDCKQCFDLPMTRTDIADFLGLTIETISRNLTRLRKLGVIDLPSAHRVCVCKASVLRNLAENDI